MYLVDVHAHLESSGFEKDLDEVIERFVESGGKLIVNSGTSPERNRECLKLSEKFDCVRCSFGMYPMRIENSQGIRCQDLGIRETWEDNVVDGELDWIEEHLDDCVAIGEIGLDFSLEKSSSRKSEVGSREEIKERQKVLFRKMLGFAKRVGRPVVIHSRKAEGDAIEILEEMGFANRTASLTDRFADRPPSADGPLRWQMGAIPKVIMHCFCGRRGLIKRCVDNGWYFSVPPVIMRWDNFKVLVKNVPIERLLTETDSPYLSSVAKERNEPVNVLVTLKEIARIKGLSVEEVGGKIFKNIEGLFLL